MAIGSPEELKARYGIDVVEIVYEGEAGTLESFGEVTAADGRLIIKTKNAEAAIVHILRQLDGVKVKSVKINKASLDTVFLTLTGTTIEEGGFDAKRFYMAIARARR